MSARPLAAPLLLALGLLLASGVSAGLQGQLLVGTVTDLETERGVGDAALRVLGRDGVARVAGVTTASGRFFLRMEAVSREDLLVVEALGYQTQHVPLGDLPSFSAAGMELEVALPPDPLAVEGVVATVRGEPLLRSLVMAGFYERQRTNFGEFRIVEEVDRDRARVLSDLFRGVQGVKLVPRRGGFAEPILRRINLSGTQCFPSTYLNGALVRRAGTSRDSFVGATAFDNLLSSNAILAFEVYASPAQVPPQYGGHNGRCGVILLWTR